ncbi:leucyl aminopeptidase [Parvularcula sp. IMCC14364]|uniref:leucyl aminopeptidase n=1 Tax=Parvularcula sp. IMCC14364 TaxID=3067902 RepID=UPI00274292DF|nr:leucyl aminopeptidase [Parvularcula sp. IMCC14364]
MITFSKSSLPKSGAVIVPVYANEDRSSAFTELNDQTGGALMRAEKAADFSGKAGQQVEVTGPDGISNSAILLIGAGNRKDMTLLEAQNLGGKAVARYFRSAEKSLVFALDGFDNDAVDASDLHAAVAYGARLRAYSFDAYRTTAEKSELPSLTKVTVSSPEATDAKKAYAGLDKVADGVFCARDLVSEPANILHPETYAARCQDLESLGLEVSVLGEKEMKKLGMGSLLGVGQGSVRESKLVVMKWMGGKKGQKPVCFVGKGVTFDTGGISLKPPVGMWDMKWDMGGSAAVTGAMVALAGRKAKANVIGIIGLVENMPDGNAQRPGDVVTSMSGQTIEVLNTDAEGRLVLADALTYTQEKFKPAAIVDLATLTGAIIISLAHEYGGCFSPDDELVTALTDAGTATGEELWRMPLGKAHDDMIKSDIADMKNIGGREGGSSSAAAFLKRFVSDDIPWAHLDIAGMAWQTKDKPTCPKGGAGYGVRLLDEFIRANYES